MKEKPIIFKTEMVRAILDGTKTQTRRVIKNCPELTFKGNTGGDEMNNDYLKKLLDAIDKLCEKIDEHSLNNIDDEYDHGYIVAKTDCIKDCLQDIYHQRDLFKQE